MNNNNLFFHIDDEGGDSHVRFLDYNDTLALRKIPKRTEVYYNHEAEALNLCEDIHGVPRVLDLQLDHLTLSYTSGVSLRNHTNLIYDTDILRQTTRTLRMIHDVEYSIDTHIPALHPQFVVDETINMLTQSNVFDFSLTETVVNFLQSNRRYLHNRPTRLTHGDFCLEHIYVEHNNLSGIIDFGDCLWTDPLMDLAFLYFHEIDQNHGDALRMKFNQFYFRNRLSTDEIYALAVYGVYWGMKKVLEHEDDNREIFMNKLHTHIQSLM